MTKANDTDIDLTFVLARIKTETARVEKEYKDQIALLRSSVFTAVSFTKIDLIEFNYEKILIQTRSHMEKVCFDDS